MDVMKSGTVKIFSAESTQVSTVALKSGEGIKSTCDAFNSISHLEKRSRVLNENSNGSVKESSVELLLRFENIFREFNPRNRGHRISCAFNVLQELESLLDPSYEKFIGGNLFGESGNDKRVNELAEKILACKRISVELCESDICCKKQ